MIKLILASSTFFQAVKVFATLCDHVVNIVLLCAKPEVGGIHAAWVVARMANEQPIWDGAVMPFVAKAMAKLCASRPLFFIASHERAIASGGSRAYPIPTIIRAALVYLFPETIFQRSAALMVGDIRVRLTLDPSVNRFGYGSDGGLLAATTSTQAAWVGRFQEWIFARVMVDKSLGFALYISETRNCSFCYLSLAATSASAETVWNFLSRLLREVKLELHRKLSFLCQARDGYSRRLALSIGVVAGVIVAEKGQLCQLA